MSEQYGEQFFDDDMEDIEPVVDADSAFFGALETLDVGRIMACWSESDGITMLIPGLEMVKGQKMVRSAWQQMADHTSKLRTVLRPENAMRLGDLGWIFLSGTILSTHGDETLSVEVYVTNIYRREVGGWKLLHHHSTPAPHQPSYLEQRLN